MKKLLLIMIMYFFLVNFNLNSLSPIDIPIKCSYLKMISNEMLRITKFIISKNIREKRNKSFQREREPIHTISHVSKDRISNIPPSTDTYYSQPTSTYV